jgi:hypothetical protein
LPRMRRLITMLETIGARFMTARELVDRVVTT